MLPAARWLAMATVDSPDPGRQIESNTPLHGGLQMSKITKKNNHRPYNTRCSKCSPPSTYFWHLFRKYAFTLNNSVSEIQSNSRLILTLNSTIVWGFVVFSLFFKCPIYKNRKPPHVRRIESKYQARNWINMCKCTFLKKIPEMCGWRVQRFQYLMLCGTVRDYFSLSFYLILGRRAAGVFLSICRPGPGLSAVAIASRRAAGDT